METITDHRAQAVTDALAERARQDAKWGEQNHDPITWSAILTEECGEFAQAALHHKFGGDAAAGLREEAVQVAAVALQIVECIDRTGTMTGPSAKEANDRLLNLLKTARTESAGMKLSAYDSIQEAINLLER